MRGILVGCMALLFLVGCNTQKRNIKRLDAYFLQYGGEASRLSNLVYPCFTGVAKSDTVIQTKIDTVVHFAPLYTVDSLSHDTVFRTRVQIKTITNTVIKTIHDTVQNMRLVASLNDQIKEKQDSVVTYRTKLVDVKHGKNIWMWIAIGSSSLILIFIIAKVVLLFYGGAAGSVINKL